MLEFTLLGYCLRRFSFKLWLARGELSPTQWYRQLLSAWAVVWSSTECGIRQKGLILWTMLSMHVGSGCFHNFQLFKSIDSLWVVLKVQDRHSLFHWPLLVSSVQYMFRECRLPVDVAKSLLCSLNLVFKFLFVLALILINITKF